jgi:hypothetical protein
LLKALASSAEKYRKKKKAAQQNHIEGKFEQNKRGYGLNNIKARLSETSESWVNTIFFIMNLTKLLQIAEKYPNIFVPFFILWKLVIKMTGKMKLLWNFSFEPIIQAKIVG